MVCIKHYNILSIRKNRLSVDEHLIRPLIKRLIYSAKRSVLNQHRSRPRRLLETELYANWLDELEFVVIALDVSYTASQLRFAHSST